MNQNRISIHEMKLRAAMQNFYEIAAFIRSHDSTYERELLQVEKIAEHGANLVRYAEAIEARIDKDLEKYMNK